MLNVLKKKNLKILIVRLFDRLKLNGVILIFLFFFKDYDDLNDLSVVVMFEFVGKRVLFIGDILKNVEYDIVRNVYDIKVDVLKVFYYGSYVVILSLFLEKVNFKVVIISVGKDNLYGYLYLFIIRRLEKFKVKIFIIE